MIYIKRVYEKSNKKDGKRILVDRLWPRGLTKEEAHIDEWLKDIAPTTELRKWFNHDVSKWSEFMKKYKAELREKKESIQKLRSLEQKEKTVTLLYAAKDEEHNQAVVLKGYLEERQ